MAGELWQCEDPDCNWKWMSRVDNPGYCPTCKKRHIHKIPGGNVSGEINDDDGDLQAMPIEGDNMTPPQQPRRARWGQDGGEPSYNEEPVARDASNIIDPNEELVNMLSDLGLKTKKATIARIFFSGNIDDPAWLDRVLKESGIDMARRRLAIMRWYGKMPEDMGVIIEPGPTDPQPAHKDGKNKVKTEDEELEETYKELRKQELQDLKERINAQRMKAIKAKLDKEIGDDDDDGGSKKKRSKNDDDENMIQMPVLDAKGMPMLNKDGNPVVMKLTPQGYFMMQQAQALAQQKADVGKTDPMTQMVMDERKFWQEQSMKLMQKDDGDKYLKLIGEFSKQREEFLQGTYKLREDILRREIKDVQGAVKGPEDWYKQILYYVGIGQKMGLVQGDPKQQIQSQMANSVVTSMNNMQADGRVLMQEMFNFMRIQSSRQMGMPGQMDPRYMAAQTPLSQQEREQFYLKGAQDMRAMIEQQMAQNQGVAPQLPAQPQPQTQAPALPTMQMQSVIPMPPPPPIPPPSPPPVPQAQEQPKPQDIPPNAQQVNITDSGDVVPIRPELGYEVQLTPASVPPPPGLGRVEVNIPERQITPKTPAEMKKSTDKVIEQTEDMVSRWGSDNPVSGIQSDPVTEDLDDPEKKTGKWSSGKVEPA